MIKRKIADWMYRFWNKNHTHIWVYEPAYVLKLNSENVKCKLCGKTTTKTELFKPKQR
jgi:hypothetical protein